MNIIALDLASKVGWASLRDDKLEVGTWKNPTQYSASPGAFMAAFVDWFADMNRWQEMEVVAYEMSAHHRTPIQSLIAHGLITRVQEWAYRHDVKQLHVWPNTLKKFATGNGNCGKDQVIVAMRKRWNWHGKDADEADALAVLTWAVHQYQPAVAVVAETKNGD